MDQNQILGVDPVKAGLIALATGYLTDLVKIILKVKGLGVVLLAFFIAVFLSVLWIVPWSVHQEADAFLAALKTAILTAIAAVTGGELRSRLKDYLQAKRGDTPDTPATTPAPDGAQETPDEQA